MNSIKKAGSPLRAPAQLVCLSFLFFSFVFYAPAVSAQYQKTQKAVTKNIDPNIGGFYESLPVDYAANSSKKYPLLIFLHGVGELGNGGSQLPLVLKNAVPKLLNAGTFPATFMVGGKAFSFIVISPQFKASSGQVASIEAMIKYCKTAYRVDESRIYLTGLSLGGMRSWDYPGSSSERANSLAAIVPVCSGASGTEAKKTNIINANMPIWFLNNSGDPYISAATAQTLVNTLNATKLSPKAKITIFQQSGHDAWTKAYDPNFRENGMNVYEWMLSYTRSASSATPPTPPAEPMYVFAGADQTITLPTNSVVVDASVKSTYPAGSTFLWEKTSGPAGGTIVSPTSLKTTIKDLNNPGDYRFQISIKDKSGNVGSTAIHVYVNAEPSGVKLYAYAGADQTITLPTNSVVVDASAKSTYPSGSTFLWEKTDGPAGGTIVSPASLKTTIKDLNNPGDYRFQISIKDKNGNVGSTAIHVYVKPAPAGVKLYAYAGADQTITLPTNSVVVDASAKSTYPAGSTFSWEKTSGPAGGTIVSPTSLKTTIKDLNNPGDYRFQISIKDKSGNVASTAIHVYVKPAPVSAQAEGVKLYAYAGADQTITLPTNSVVVDASAKSTYPAGSTFSWEKTNGPAGGTIVSPTSLKTTIKDLNNPGDYRFQISIKDKSGNVASTAIHVYVKPAPVSAQAEGGKLYVYAGADQTIKLPTNSVVVDASVKSTYPAGSTFFWEKTSGPAGGTIVSPTALKTTIKDLNNPGDYRFQITIKDKSGNVASTAIHVYVNPAVNSRGSSPLHADAGEDQTITLPTSTVKITGVKNSTGPEGSVHVWEQVSGPKTVNILNPWSIGTDVTGFTVPGVYGIRLKITDPAGNVATSIVTITVKSLSTPLHADAGEDQTITLPTSMVKITGVKNSTGPEGSVHVWEQASGPKTVNILNPWSIGTDVTGFTVPGVYGIRLKITDPTGNIATSIVTITVKSAVSGRTMANADENSGKNESLGLGLPEISAGSADLDVKVNPNPVRSDMTLVVSGASTGKVSVTIYNMSGQILLQQEFVKDAQGIINKTINVSQLAPGIYIGQVTIDNREKKTIKILKQ